MSYITLRLYNMGGLVLQRQNIRGRKGEHTRGVWVRMRGFPELFNIFVVAVCVGEPAKGVLEG